MSPLFGSGRRDEGERSAADRERARLEREARRARREGRPEPALPPLEEEPPPPGVEPEWDEPIPSAAPEPAPRLEAEAAPPADRPVWDEPTAYHPPPEPVAAEPVGADADLDPWDDEPDEEEARPAYEAADDPEPPYEPVEPVADPPSYAFEPVPAAPAPEPSAPPPASEPAPPARDDDEPPEEGTGEFTFEHPVPSNLEAPPPERVRAPAAPAVPVDPRPEPEPDDEPTPAPLPSDEPPTQLQAPEPAAAVGPDDAPPVDAPPDDEPQAGEAPPPRRDATHDFDALADPPAAFAAAEAADEGPHDPDAPAVRVLGRDEAPTGVRRVSPSGLASAAGAQGPPRFGATPDVPRKRRRWGRRLALLLPLVVIVAAVLYVLNALYEPFAGGGGSAVRVSIASGSTASEVADVLEQRGVISSAFFFNVRSRLDGERASLRAGSYTLQEDMPYEAVITALTTAPTAAPTIDVTVPEGRSRRESAPVVEQAGLEGSYLTASRESSVLDPRDYGAPRSTASLEGFLFPSTYELRRGATARRLVLEQVREFRRQFADIDLSRARARDLSRFDVVTIASMIEREATLPRERRTIAAVIYNRLRQGIPLGIDATTRFETDNWTQPLRQSVLEDDTPYNTRLNSGLPPGPIGSPGLASLQAAANPSSSDALYYVVRPCGDGAHSFSATDAEFQQDVAAYNAARERRGGRDPSRC